MAKREFVMLAHKFNPKKHSIAGKMMSVKLDGIRCFWDGGVSRGLLASEVPFANTAKDDRYINEPVATGLWTRYGKTIQAPAWWLDRLPNIPLDGELYITGKRQDLISIVKDLIPDERWAEVSYQVFDSPPIDEVLKSGVINAGPLFKKTIGPCNSWWKERKLGVTRPAQAEFIDTHKWLKQFDINVLTQERLSMSTEIANARVNQKLSEVLSLGGEGLILRSPYSRWIPERSYDLLKIKPRSDSEATVIGYTWARAGKIEGLMGSLELEWKNPIGQKVQFSISGFTDKERAMTTIGTCHGCKVVDATNPRFPIGALVTFSYRTLTEDGKPDEAQYLRPYDAV
jgi:DNA ligase-1